MIAGLGRTGEAVARFLHARGDAIVLTDDRLAGSPLPALKDISGDDLVVPIRRDVLAGADLVAVSPGVPLSMPALAELPREKLTSDLLLFREKAAAPVVGITGSNGKSTVTELVGLMAADQRGDVAVGGNIGTPCVALLDEEVGLYVLELSSYQLELADDLPLAVATILNLSPDHLDRYPSLDAYYAAKANILRHAGKVVLGRDIVGRFDIDCVTFGDDVPPRLEDFGLRDDEGVTWLVRGNDRLVRLDALALPGRHNAINTLAALAIATEAGLELQACLAVARRFTGLPHRTERVAMQAGITWINDSKATNPGATLAAVTGLAADRNLVLILGGDGKGADFSPLVEPVSRHAHDVIVLGQDREAIASTLEDKVPVTRCTTLEEAVAVAADVAVAGDIVLLSPACASTDMFSNFEERGTRFADLAREVAA